MVISDACQIKILYYDMYRFKFNKKDTHKNIYVVTNEVSLKIN